MALFRRTPQASEAVQIQEIRERHNLSQQVYFRRDGKNWSQTDLAEKCGTTQAQIANIEAGRVNPTLNTLVRLAAAFGCLAHDLLRPQRDDDEWERPETRDWARWTRDKGAHREDRRSKEQPAWAMRDVTAAAFYHTKANASMALNT